jgi:hypothetical protein
MFDMIVMWRGGEKRRRKGGAGERRGNWGKENV